MRRLLVPCLALGLLPAAPASGEAPPYLEFVRGLRRDGMADLALQYLEELQAHPPAGVADALPLELARTRMEMAANELDEAKRTAMIEGARKGFEDTLRKTPNHAEANADLARLRHLLARAQLVKARRLEDADARAADAARARPEFDEAAKQFRKAAGLLEDEINKASASDAPRLRLLNDELAQVKIQEARNLYSLTETYLAQDQATLLEKAKAVQRARRAFSAIYESAENPDRTAWLALAWYAHLTTLMNEPLVAAKKFDEILARRSDPAAADGYRQARFFKVVHTFEGKDDGGKPAAGDAFTATAPLAQAWLKDYPSQRNSPEGLTVRFYYAISEAKIAVESRLINFDPKTNRVTSLSGNGANFLQEAARTFKELTDSENEYTESARRRRQDILVWLADGEEKGTEIAVPAVATFERAVLQAHIQEARLSQFERAAAEDTSGEAQKKVKAEEARRIGRATAFLERALALATNRDAPRDVFDAKLFLARCYLNGGQPMSAAVFAENLARTSPGMPKAAEACSVAVQGYNRMAAEVSGTEGGKPMGDVDLRHLKSLAAFMEATWPNSPATDEARHFWAFYAGRDRKYAEAIDVFARIRPTYTAVDQARLQQGSALFSLIRGDTDSAELADVVPARIKANAKQWTETIKALHDLKAPPATAPQAEAQSYFNARLQYCQLLQLEGKNFKEVEQTAAAALKGLEEAKGFAQPEAKDELLFAVKAMRLNGVQGQAAKLIRDGTPPAKVLDAVRPTLDQIRAEIDAAADAKNRDQVEKWQKVPSYERYSRGQRDIVIIALRSSIQDGKLDEATALLDTLEKSGGSLESRLANLRSLAATVRAEFDKYRRLGKADDEKKLVEGFSKFLDRIAAQPKQPVSMQMFLAQGYSGIDQNAKSVELFDKLLKTLPVPKAAAPAPAQLEGEEAKKAEEAAAAARTYRQVQYSLARSLRLAKMYDRAREMLEKELIGGPWPASKADYPKGPFFNSLEARKERAYLYEDQGDFRSAVAYWTVQAKQFGEPLPAPNPANDKDARKRVVYFDLFFEAQRCAAKAYDHLDKAKYATQKAAGFEKVAKQLYDMETKNSDLSTGLKDRVRELLEEYKPLKDKYKALGGKLLEG